MDRRPQRIHTQAAAANRRGNAFHQNPDVFLSFSGLDTRKSLVDHIRHWLQTAGVNVFRDDEDLLCEEIEPGLCSAIKNSKMVILIISKNYGRSEWCLNELRDIMRLRNADRGREIIPIFYEVGVSDVRDQTGEFGEGFHELAKKHMQEQVKEWRGALRSLAGIKAWSACEHGDGYQVKLLEWLKKKVLSIVSEGPSVFPIFSPDVKMNLGSQLLCNLKQNNISVFRDDDWELIGKNLAEETLNAMKRCKIFVLIISKNFASSRECLNHLLQMFECQKKKESKILPIFFKIKSPQDQEVLDGFKKDMLRHVEQYNPLWQTCLYKVCKMGGLVSENIGYGDEGELVNRAISQVGKLLGNNLNARSPSTEY